MAREVMYRGEERGGVHSTRPAGLGGLMTRQDSSRRVISPHRQSRSGSAAGARSRFVAAGEDQFLGINYRSVVWPRMVHYLDAAEGSSIMVRAAHKRLSDRATDTDHKRIAAPAAMAVTPATEHHLSD